MKQTFNHVDYIANDRYVFNIRGNHYRLIAFVGTHAEYDRIAISTIEPDRL